MVIVKALHRAKKGREDKKRFQQTLANRTYLAMLLFFYALAASQAMWSFSYKWTTIESHPQYSLEKTLAGSTPKPYAYRILIPRTINLLVGIIPDAVAKPLLERSRAALEATIGADAARFDDRRTQAYGLILQLNFVLLFCTLILLRQLARSLIDNADKSPLIVDIAPILFELLLTVSYRSHNGFIYDHFELFALTLYLYLVSKSRYFAALLLLVFSVLNKETAIFFPVFGAIIRWRQGFSSSSFDNKRVFFREIIVVTVCFAVVRIMFQDHPGQATEWHFSGNVAFWLSLEPWIALTTPHLQVLPMPKPSNIILLAPMLLVVLGYWSKKPAILKQLLLAAFFINAPLFLLFSYRDEFRNLSLLFPFLFLSATHSIREYFNSRLT